MSVINVLITSDSTLIAFLLKKLHGKPLEKRIEFLYNVNMFKIE